jgi:hypothetical protein
MEWFFPSLMAIFLGFLAFMYLLPKMSPYILGATAIILFFVGAQQHFSTFGYEYNSANFSNTLHDYAPFLTVIVGILGTVVASMLAFGSTSSGSVIPAMPAMPSLASVPAMPAMPSLASIPSPFASPKANNTANKGFNFSLKSSPARNIVSNSFKTA